LATKATFPVEHPALGDAQRSAEPEHRFQDADVQACRRPTIDVAQRSMPALTAAAAVPCAFAMTRTLRPLMRCRMKWSSVRADPLFINEHHM